MKFCHIDRRKKVFLTKIIHFLMIFFQRLLLSKTKSVKIIIIPLSNESLKKKNTKNHGRFENKKPHFIRFFFLESGIIEMYGRLVGNIITDLETSSSSLWLGVHIGT